MSMRGAIEAEMPSRVTLYKGGDRTRELNADPIRVGTARARIEYGLRLMTGADGVQEVQGVMRAFFFNDLQIDSGDYLSISDTDVPREIITLNEQTQHGIDNYVEATVAE